MTNESRMAHLASPVKTARSLSAQQRSLMQLMHEHQFGRIENMSIRAGQPLLDSNVRVVRAARLGAKSGGTNTPRTDDFELKKAIRELFDELERLGSGTVLRLEFRHGLPYLLETTSLLLSAPT
jgi:hypothetical protein